MSEQKMKRQVQYGGPLSPSQGAAGIKAARENAQQLAREARLLFDAQAYARASSLALLAIEEVGKVPIIRRLVAAEENELKPLWREFRSHTAKNFFTGYREVALTALKRGEPKVDDFDRLFRAEADEPHLYDALKQLGFYADCVGECHWSRPAEVIEQDLAKHMVASAELMSGDGKAESGIDSEAGLALWQKHMRGVRLEQLREALKACYAEAAAAGIIPESESREMESFLQRRA